MTRTLRLDDLVGVHLRDRDGNVVGRIYDMRAEERNGELVIVEYLVGASALQERLGISLLRLIGLGREHGPKHIPWDRVDLSDPERPVLINR